MRNKSLVFLFALIFMIVFSLSAVSADDLQSTDSGTVSGDVNVTAVNPWSTSGELTYDVPAEAKEIKSADLYVNVYSGSAQNTYGANANVSINTASGEKQIASEQLWIEDGSADGTIYTVNDHINKCYSDYQMYYDLTDTFKGLNGSSVTIKVDTFKMENKSFDGRIKLMALILAYDDGDNDTINYWVDSTQKWTKTNVTTTFATEVAYDIAEADLINIALSSADGSYKLNGELIGDALEHVSGNYYQYNYWNVTDKVKDGYSTELLSMNAGTSSYGSLKNVLTVLKLQSNIVTADVTLATEYSTVNTCYAGTNNVITIKTKADKAANYTVELLADGKVINSTVVALDGANETTLLLTDPTIRPIDETTVNGADNNKVTYAVNVNYEGSTVGSASIVVPVLYNGYLGKDMEYNATYIEDITVIQVTGEVGFMVQNASTYMGAGVTNRTDEWLVLLDENSTLTNAFVYLAYNWDKSGAAGPVFNLTFNGQNITPIAHYRDQSNLGSSGKYGYGLFIYDVTDLMKNGNNVLVLNKPSGLTAVYPSNLIYLYDTEGSDHLTTVLLANGVDLLSYSTSNKAGRTVKTDSRIPVNPQYVTDESLFVFAASAQSGEGNLIINGVENTNVWNGTSNSLEVYPTFLDNASDVNVSFVATGSTILALNQMVVTVKELVSAEATLATEYTSVNTCYAGTNNTITITAKANKAANYTIYLLADDMCVNETVVALDGENKTTILLTDPTIRPIDETTVNGADNKKVNYTVLVYYGDFEAGNASKVVPVLYDGYLGKDFAYNATFIEDINIIQGTGHIVVDNKDASTYMAGGATNRTDVWTISLGDDDNLTDALIYIAYNWDKTQGVDGPEFNVTFNGEKITPKAHYRDQSNLGSSGKYGYGMYVYDVSDLAKNGTNTLTINKPAGLTAVYPSNLIYAYDTAGSKLMSTAYIVEGVDLLANSYNNAGRVVKTDSQIYVDKANVLISGVLIFAAGAQKGEGNVIINGVENVDVWNGTANSLDYAYLPVDNLSDENNISFVATGSTILALNQMILTTKEIVTAEVNLATEYTSVNTCYAGTNNTITIKAKADKATNYTVLLLDGDVVVNSTVVALDGENKTTILLTDPTIRPINETTVNGANNTEVTYGVIIKYGEEVVGGNSITVPVLYDGYLGKDFAYNATFIEGVDVIQVTGGIIADNQDASTYMATSATNRTDVWTIGLGDDDTLAKALVYIAYNWDKTPGVDGPEFNVTFNGEKITPKAHYRDQSNLGSSGKYGYGMYVYDVSDLAKNGTNTLTINKPKGLTAVYPSNLIYAYDVNGSKFMTTAYMLDGVDLFIASSYNNAGRVVKSDSQAYVENANVLDSGVLIFAAGAQKGEGNVIINGVENVDVWNGTDKTLDYVYFPLDEISDVNNISFVATGSTIVALNQIIVTTKEIIESEVTLSTEYSNTCYAGTENVITIDVKADKKAYYTVILLADDVVVDRIEVLLDGENKTTVLMLDETIRPVDETTVNGANNTKVTYAAIVKYGDEIVGGASKTVPVLYNGYLGKDKEYNATYIQDITVVKFNGMIIDAKDDTTYIAAGATNRTDVWEIDLNNESTFAKVMLYLAYNWDKTPGVDGPELNVTFNGKTITPISRYRDQSNLGSYGKYGYGLYVYDVTSFAQDGNNTMVLNKPSGLTAVYPSNLICFINNTSWKAVYTAYMADGVDLLSYSSSNKAGRIVITDSEIPVATEGVSMAELIVFAASAQKGEGNLIINDHPLMDIWNGTSNSLEGFTYDLTDNLLDENVIKFVSTGATIVALNQMIITGPKAIDGEFANIIVDGNACVGATLVDANGTPVANESIHYSVNGVENTTTTNDKGEFVIQATSSSVVEIWYAGNGLVLPVNTTITLKDLAPTKIPTAINSQQYTTYAIDVYAGEKGGYFKVQLLDANGTPLANKSVKIGFNGVVYDKVTDASGWAQLQINLAKEGEYTFAVVFLGDDEYDASFVVEKIVVNKKKTSISASSKSFKASAKTKSYTVTLKTDKGSSIDGKIYLNKGKKLTMTLNGKTYTAKTNSKGQATFKLSITKKGKFTSKVKFEGDNTYAASSKSVKITIK